MKTGDSVTWIWEPRGGWGYQIPVPATVVRIGKARVYIDAELEDGRTKRISVRPEKLRPPRGGGTRS